MKLGLLAVMVAMSGTARAQGLPKVDFDRGVPEPAALLSLAPAAFAGVPAAARVNPERAARAGLPAGEPFRVGKSGYKVVEQTLKKGKVLDEHSTLCFQDPGDLACWNAATKDPVHVPAALLPGGGRTPPSARALAAKAFDAGTETLAAMTRRFQEAEPGFRLAHSYNTQNGRSTFSCYHVTLYRNCRWVMNGGGIGSDGVSVQGEWRCDEVEGPHQCECISGC